MMMDLVRATAAEAAEFALWASGSRGPFDSRFIANVEDLDKFGVTVLKGYVSRSKVELLKNEVDHVFSNSTKVLIDKVHSDHRIFGADRKSTLIKEFFNDHNIRQIGTFHCRNTFSTGFTMAAKMIYRPNNEGSGAGWHRDSPIRRQFKSIVYLTDVASENGPFEYILRSHKNLSVLALIRKELQRYRQYRFTDAEIRRILEISGLEKRTFIGEAGDVILADTRGIHRGAPIEAGTRYAMTNYFFTKTIPPHFLEWIEGPL